MHYFYFSFTPHWGLMLNEYGFTKSRPVLSFIPPTSIIGALSYSLSKFFAEPEVLDDRSIADKYRGMFNSINVSMPIYSSYYDLSRVLFIYRGEARSDAVATGKLYSLLKDERATVDVVIIIDEDKAKELIGERWRKMLEAACLSITRVGARESIVTPIRVDDGKPVPLSDKVVKTRFSFPSYSLKKIIEGAYLTGRVIDWRVVSIGRYVGMPTVGYIVPSDLSQGLRVELEEGSKAYKVGEEVVISWK